MDPPEPSPPFGDLLRRLRRAAGLTQAELAERAGLSVDAIGTLERGERRTPHRDTVMLLADALNLSPDDGAHLYASARRTASLGNSSVQTGSSIEAKDVSWPTGGFLGALPTVPLIARDTEVEQVQAALAAVTEGLGRCVLLSGEPGVGKTRLAQEVAQVARTQGFLVATGRCYEPEQTVPYYPFLEALSQVYAMAPAPARATVPQRWREVLRLLPDHQVEAQAILPSGEMAVAVGNRLEQQQLLWAITGFVQVVAERQPIALLLDDLHWADSASMALLTHLARKTRLARVLLLGTYRDERAVIRQPPLSVAIRDLRRDQLLEHIAVEPLSLEATAALIAVSLGMPTVPAELAALVYQRTEGNPFFTQEVLRALLERGDLSQRHGGWERLADTTLPAPDTVRAVIEERVARLSGPTQQTLSEASVLGQAFAFADLVGMRTRPESELETALEEATIAGLIRERGDDRYAFHHVLIQQTLYEELPAHRRQRLHGLAGDALERLSEREREQRVAELAYHYRHSAERGKALGYLVRAAEQAHLVGAFWEEVAFLDPAIELAEAGQPSPLTTADLRAKRGLAYLELSLWQEADRDLRAALDGATVLTAEQRIRVLAELAEVRQWLWDPSGTRRFAAEARALAEQIGRPDLAAAAISAVGRVESFDGALHDGLEHFEQAIASAGRDDLRLLASAHEWSGIMRYWLGRYPEAVEREQRSIALSQQAHNIASTCSTWTSLALALAGTGRYTEALQAIGEAERVGREQSIDNWRARAMASHGGIHLAIFDFAGARAQAEETREFGRSVRFPNAVISSGLDLLLIDARTHELSGAHALLDELVEAASRGEGIHRWLFVVRLAEARAEFALAREAWEEGVQLADDAIAQSRQRGRVKYEILALVTRARALAGLGRTREAISTLRRAIMLARPVGDPAQFLSVAAALLSLDGDDALAAEARAAADRIVLALPDSDFIRRFEAAEPVRALDRLTVHPRQR